MNNEWLKDFVNNKNCKLDAIYCDTEEKAKNLLEMMRDMGAKWEDGDDPTLAINTYTTDYNNCFYMRYNDCHKLELVYGEQNDLFNRGFSVYLFGDIIVVLKQ